MNFSLSLQFDTIETKIMNLPHPSRRFNQYTVIPGYSMDRIGMMTMLRNQERKKPKKKIKVKIRDYNLGDNDKDLGKRESREENKV